MQFIQADIQFAQPLYQKESAFADGDGVSRRSVEKRLTRLQRRLLQAGEWTLTVVELDARSLRCDALGAIDGEWRQQLQTTLAPLGAIQSVAVAEITMDRFDGDIDNDIGGVLTPTLWRAFGLYSLVWNRRNESFTEGFADENRRPFVVAPTLQAELARIGETSVQAAHPAHYLLSGDPQALQAQLDVLLGALYHAGQLRSLRFAHLRLGTPVAMAQLFEASRGATIVLDVPQKLTRLPDALVALIREHRDSVLLVVNTPHKLSRQAFAKALPDLLFVALDQSDLTRGEADDYIQKALAASKRHGDADLQARLDALQYPVAQAAVSTAFAAWQSDQERAERYPAYRHAAASLRAPVADNGDAYAELQALVGLENVKTLVDTILANRRTQMQRKRAGLKVEAPALHMCFTGNPGTAKTTVARLIGKIFRDNGILRVGDFFDCSRSDLVAGYAGQTAPLVAQRFAEASGSVLLLDEAYSVVQGPNDQFGHEAVAEIVKQMEDHRDDCVVIFTGYPKEMAAFLDANSGLASRVAYNLAFADYDTATLTRIATHIAAEKDYRLTPKSLAKMARVLAKQRAVDPAHFGNGRAARMLVEHAIVAQAQRLDRLGHAASLTQLQTLLPQDLEAEAAAPAETGMRPIGF